LGCHGSDVVKAAEAGTASLKNIPFEAGTASLKNIPHAHATGHTTDRTHTPPVTPPTTNNFFSYWCKIENLIKIIRI